MKHQIARLSPHQNGKVFGVLSAIGAIAFLVPVLLVVAATRPADAPASPSPFVFLLAPLFYLAVGYVSVAAGCLLYNVMFKHLGGIEYEAREVSDASR